ncbi:MAG: ribonuclease P protein component [Desulforhopalus sp.]|nr:ribonuclease P protein component [Desulforhopalus sp.]
MYSSGRRLHSKGFSLICLDNDLPFNRLGISVHRKIRGAALRNRLKRIIRETFRCNRDLFPSAMDIVFTIRPDFILDHPVEIRAAVETLVAGLRRA